MPWLYLAVAQGYWSHTLWPVTSNDRDLLFFFLASSDSSFFSIFLLPFLLFRSQGPGECLGAFLPGTISLVLLDRLSSLTACCRLGLAGRQRAGVSRHWGSSLSLRECKDRLLRSLVGSIRFRRSDSITRVRRRAAFTTMLLVPLIISLRSANARGRWQVSIVSYFNQGYNV